MKYDTIEIRPAYGGGWQVLHRELPCDRKKGEPALHSVFGVFHYPRKWGKKKDLDTLRNQMINDRLEAIAELQSQIDQLRVLTAPE